MKTNTDLDQIYSHSFESYYQEFLHQTLSAFKENTGKTLIAKRNNVFEAFNETFKTLTTQKIGAGNYMPDYYTHNLIGRFTNRKHDYEVNPVTHFMNEHWEDIKKENENFKPAIPDNIKLSPAQTVELVAKYEALQLFLARLDSLDKGDTIEICEKKLSQEGYRPPIIPAKQSETEIILAEAQDKEREELYRKEFTANRQVLAIKYLFKLQELKGAKFDNTKLTEFIRFLTGRELGANNIRNTTIYKRVISNKPENVEDLKHIRKYFIDLKLSEIVAIINEEIESASK